MDDRETTSTQRGIYAVFVFPEDMPGVYLSLNQGVTELINEHGRVEGRQILRDRARAVRMNIRDDLTRYNLDGGIDLKTEGALGLDYQASTIAYRYYAKGEIPNDRTLNQDLDQLITANDRLLQARPVPEVSHQQWWIFQANPKIFDVDAAIRELDELTWTVKGSATEASIEDRVFIWRSGKEAGVIALGTIIKQSTARENLPAELPYILDNDYKIYYNSHRVHRSLGGSTPVLRAGASSAVPVLLGHHAWRPHCRGLFQTPIAA